MDIITIIKPFDAVLEDDHFVYATGRHGSAWLNKDALIPHAELIQTLCAHLAEAVAKQGLEFDVIAGPAVGGVLISHWLGLFLDKPSLYLEREQDTGSKRFICRRGFDGLLADSRVLLVDDVIDSGNSLVQCKQVIEDLRAEVVAVVALIDRGNIADDFFACPMVSLATYKVPSWAADECPLCREGVPINTGCVDKREPIIA